MDGTQYETYLEPLRPLAPDTERALEGAVFPLLRKQLICIARENDAPARLLTLLGGIADTSYASLEQVMDAVHAQPGAGVP